MVAATANATNAVPYNATIAAPLEAANASEIVIARGRLLGALKAVTPFACQDETRFHLCAVAIECAPGAMLRLVATDGHTLARVDVRTLPDSTRFGALDTTLLAREDAAQLIKALAHRRVEAGKPVRLTFAGRTITVQVDAATYSYTAIDAHYPNYASVIPSYSDGRHAPAARVALDPHYLARACDAVAALGRKHGESTRGAVVTLGPTDGDPITVAFDDPEVGEFLAVVMPMRM